MPSTKSLIAFEESNLYCTDPDTALTVYSSRDLPYMYEGLHHYQENSMSELPTIMKETTVPAPMATDLFQLEPAAKMKYAADIANVLKDIIEKQHLYTRIGPGKHVNIEGWSTLGTILGILPKESKVVKTSDGYEAHVELIRATDGTIMGGASSICTRNERTWAKRDDYALRSMAITRATGKAYRLAFAWIITMAGYRGTPLEEMPQNLPQNDGPGFNSDLNTHFTYVQKQIPEINDLTPEQQREIFKTVRGLPSDVVIGKIKEKMKTINA